MLHRPGAGVAQLRAATAEEIKVAERKVEEARKIASETKVEVSENRNDLLVLTRYAGMTEESAQIFNGLFSIIVVSILLSFGSMHAELEELRKHGPRKPFGILTNLWRKFYRVWKGTEPPGVKIIENTTIEYKTDRPLAAGFAGVGRKYGVV